MDTWHRQAWLQKGHGQLNDAKDRQEPCAGHASEAGQRGQRFFFSFIVIAFLCHLLAFVVISLSLVDHFLNMFCRLSADSDLIKVLSRWVPGRVQWYSSWTQSTKRQVGESQSEKVKAPEIGIDWPILGLATFLFRSGCTSWQSLWLIWLTWPGRHGWPGLWRHHGWSPCRGTNEPDVELVLAPFAGVFKGGQV